MPKIEDVSQLKYLRVLDLRGNLPDDALVDEHFGLQGGKQGEHVSEFFEAVAELGATILVSDLDAPYGSTALARDDDGDDRDGSDV